MTLRTLNYGNYGIFLIMGHAGFCPSAVVKGPGYKAVSKIQKRTTLTLVEKNSGISDFGGRV